MATIKTRDLLQKLGQATLSGLQSRLAIERHAFYQSERSSVAAV